MTAERDGQFDYGHAIGQTLRTGIEIGLYPLKETVGIVADAYKKAFISEVNKRTASPYLTFLRNTSKR